MSNENPKAATMKTVSSEQRFPVGTQFTRRGKNEKGRVYTIVDFLITKNLAGETVRRRYVSTSEFMGQTVYDYDTPTATVAMGEINP